MWVGGIAQEMPPKEFHIFDGRVRVAKWCPWGDVDKMPHVITFPIAAAILQGNCRLSKHLSTPDSFSNAEL